MLGALNQSTQLQPPAAEEQAVTIRLNVNLIVLHASVVDSSGHPVSGLSQAAFRLFVDGANQPITSFQTDDAPVTAGILLDNSASMTGKAREVLAAAMAFARESNPHDQMFVIHFNDQPRFGLSPELPFTADIAELEKALTDFKAAGTTALYDAVVLGLSQLRRATIDRKVLLIISDGGDNSSQANLPDVMKLVQRAGVVIYTIGIYDDNDEDRNPQVLSQFAEATGGRSFLPPDLKDFRQTCVEIAHDIRRQYTLGFEGAEDGQFHRIHVTAHDHNRELTVRARTGYLAPNP